VIAFGSQLKPLSNAGRIHRSSKKLIFSFSTPWTVWSLLIVTSNSNPMCIPNRGLNRKFQKRKTDIRLARPL
jgi:hypothetical protein